MGLTQHQTIQHQHHMFSQLLQQVHHVSQAKHAIQFAMTTRESLATTVTAGHPLTAFTATVWPTDQSSAKRLNVLHLFHAKRARTVMLSILKTDAAKSPIAVTPNVLERSVNNSHHSVSTMKTALQHKSTSAAVSIHVS